MPLCRPFVFRTIQLIVSLLLALTIPAIAGYALPTSTELSAWNSHHLTPRGLPEYTCDDSHGLSPESWTELQIDEYLKTYPGGDRMTFPEYVRNISVTNFECGIGLDCLAGQICSPIGGRAWWVLAAVQQLNYYLNSLNVAVAFAGSIAKAIAGKLVDDLYDQSDKRKAAFFQKMGMILTLVLAIVATAAAAVFVLVPGTQGFAIMATTGAIVAVAQVTTLLKSHEFEEKAAEKDPFFKWAALDGYLADWQIKAQQAIAFSMDSVLASGVSTEEGIYGVLKGGQYCHAAQPENIYDLQTKLSHVLTILLVGKILRSMKSFVTINDSECKWSGPNGALPIEEGFISWCDTTNKLFYNVVWDQNGDTAEKYYNAQVLPNVYGITPEYIVKQSLACHAQGRDPDYDPYTADGNDKPRTTIPDPNVDCILNLPVCDLTNKAVRDDNSKHTVVRACRHYGGISLP